MNNLAQLFETELRKASPKKWHYIHCKDTRAKPFQVFEIRDKGVDKKFFGDKNTSKNANLHVAITADSAETIDDKLVAIVNAFKNYQHTTKEGLSVLSMTDKGGQIMYDETKRQYTGFRIFALVYTGDI